jgi:Bacterial regulatory protein, Fis family
MPILLEDLNLRKAELLLCQNALARAGSIMEAAQLLGITRHALKRRMLKHRIEWPAVSQPATLSGVPTVRDHRPPTSPERAAPRSNPPEST